MDFGGGVFPAVARGVVVHEKDHAFAPFEAVLGAVAFEVVAERLAEHGLGEPGGDEGVFDRGGQGGDDGAKDLFELVGEAGLFFVEPDVDPAAGFEGGGDGLEGLAGVAVVVEDAGGVDDVEGGFSEGVVHEVGLGEVGVAGVLGEEILVGVDDALADIGGEDFGVEAFHDAHGEGGVAAAGVEDDFAIEVVGGAIEFFEEEGAAVVDDFHPGSVVVLEVPPFTGERSADSLGVVGGGGCGGLSLGEETRDAVLDGVVVAAAAGEEAGADFRLVGRGVGEPLGVAEGEIIAAIGANQPIEDA